VGGPLLGFLALALLAATGSLIAATLRIQRPAEAVLAIYIVASAEVVGLFLFLSAFDAVTRRALIAGLVALLAAAFGAWVLAGSGHLPSLPRRPFADLVERGPLLALATAVGLGLAYLIALIAATPPNGWDPANYHLARAGFWLQSGDVGYIANAYDQRLNFNPPNGEIGFAFVLGITHEENLVGFVQFFAALASAIGVFALARRIGLRRGEAAFGALAFLSLPLIALQSSGAKNDLIVASYLVGAAVFLLGDSRRSIALGSVATALAIGTKFTAAYGLAILFALVLVAPPPGRRTLRLVGLAVGGVVGSYWYVVNAHETGHFLGDQSNVPGLTAPLHPAENLLTAVGTLVDTVDLSGARGADILLYPLAAVALTIGLAVFSRNDRRKVGSLLLTAAFVASPLLLLVVSKHLGRPGLLRLDDALGRPKAYLAAADATATSPTTASDTVSWYGPIGLLLPIVTGIAGVRLARRGSIERLAVGAALAPVAWFALVALTLTYNPWLGRFFVFPIALSAALWGLALRSSSTAWAGAALAGVTLALSLVHYVEKPSGLRLLDRSAPTASVWTMERWQIQSQHDPAIGPVFRFVDHDVPRRSAIALALGANDFGYPVFGPHLERRVELVPFGSSAREVETDWLVASRERTPEIDVSCWRAALRSDEATVFRHVAGCAR
jgi:hypothetical protein